MKRSVKAFARAYRMYGQGLRLFDPTEASRDPYYFKNERLRPTNECIVPVTITYDDGTKPKRGKRARGRV